MDQELTSRLAVAVARGVRARSRFYASIELEDEQYLGPPALAETIAQLETACGRALPPSYKTFLAMHDGWTMIDGGCDLLPIAQLLAGPTAEKIRKWQASMAKDGEQVLAAGLVIGFSAISQKRIILDFGVVGDSGECRLIQWDDDEFIEYDSFIGWLEASALEFEEIAASPGDGP